MKKHGLLALLLCLSLLLGGCYAALRTKESSTSTQVTKAPLSSTERDAPKSVPQVKGVYYADNLRGASSVISTVFPMEDGAYIGNFNYFDVEHQTIIFPCSLPGCKHADTSCPARVENMSEVLAHGDSIYAFCDESNRVSLVRYVPQAGERTVLFSLTPQKPEDVIHIGSSFYSTEKIFFNVTEMTEEATLYSLHYYDLVTDKLVMLFQGDALSYAEFECAYGDRAIVSWSQYKEAPLEFEEYQLEHPDADEDDYYKYLKEFSEINQVSELRCYDLNTLEYTDFCPVLQNGTDLTPNLYLSSDGCGYGEYILYALGEDVCRYSMRTDIFEVLTHAPNAINAFLYDAYLYLILSEEDGLHFRLYDPETGEQWELENEGNREHMVFGAHDQTKTAFFGLYNGKRAMISKADFFAEAYENVVFY
mgnify:CR=1 FL=1